MEKKRPKTDSTTSSCHFMPFHAISCPSLLPSLGPFRSPLVDDGAGTTSERPSEDQQHLKEVEIESEKAFFASKSQRKHEKATEEPPNARPLRWDRLSVSS